MGLFLGTEEVMFLSQISKGELHVRVRKHHLKLTIVLFAFAEYLM